MPLVNSVDLVMMNQLFFYPSPEPLLPGPGHVSSVPLSEKMRGVCVCLSVPTQEQGYLVVCWTLSECGQYVQTHLLLFSQGCFCNPHILAEPGTWEAPLAWGSQDAEI